LVWYAINVIYNLTNKKALKVFDFPLTVTVVQLGSGILYFVPLWLTGLRKTPSPNIVAVAPVACIHSIGSIVTVMSLGAGSLAFVNVVKSLEPLFNVIFGIIFMNSHMPFVVYLTLIPLVGGVALASASELNFTWECFAFAMGSNIAFSMRGILSKKLGQKPAEYRGENMIATNQFAVVTIIAFLTALPAAVAVEGPRVVAAFHKACADAPATDVLGIQLSFPMLLLASGLSFYLYNEVAMITLDAVHPVTHAVGNTIKRVILMLVSVFAFGSELTTNGMIGSAIAIVGVFSYAVVKEMTAGKKASTEKKTA